MGAHAGTGPLLSQPHSLFDTEAVLFVNNNERESIEVDTFLEQGMRTNHDLCNAITNCFKRGTSFRFSLAAGKPCEVNAQRPKPFGMTDHAVQ